MIAHEWSDQSYYAYYDILIENRLNYLLVIDKCETRTPDNEHFFVVVSCDELILGKK